MALKKLLLFSLFVLLEFYPVKAIAQSTVAINPDIQYQTIEGWGHGGGILGGCGGPFSMLDASVANPVNYQYMDFLADDLGLTGSRITEVGPRTDGTGMDNGDCDAIDWTKFQANSLDPGMATYLVYFKNKVLAKGYSPSFYSSTGYPTNATSQKPWVLNHPGERAQQIWANAVYMRDTYGIDINYAVIYNEPSGAITATILSDDIKALAPRLSSHGLATRSQFAEAIAPQNDWDFIQSVENDAQFWPNVGRISYHNYGTADPYRSYLRDFGLSKGITTAQTEMGNPGFDDLYNDLTLGGVSYWEVGYSSNVTLTPTIGLTGFTPSSYYIRLHQVLHYVTPGSVRIDAVADDPLLHVLAFTKNGAVTTIIDNTNAANASITLTGLPAGNYGISKAQPAAATFQESGIQTVGASGILNLTANGGSWVTTVYPYSGPNHAPDIMTFTANPGYLVSPVTSATLAAAASDEELNPLTYLWTVDTSPAGATPVFVSSNAATTMVNGLTAAGTYVFNIAVNDGMVTSNRKVYLITYNSNPAPVLGSAGFRVASPYGLIFGAIGEMTHANIELPTSSATLQVGISDLANTDFTGRGTWTLLSQPPGGTATVGATTYIFVSIRAMVSGMTVPGNYVFQVNVTNPGFPNLTTQITCTVHPQSLAPIISSVTAFPASVTLPSETTLLTAVTSDPEGDLLRHWWTVTACPAGANPIFEHQGLAVSNVSGLTVPGNYVFTLRCFDDLHMTTHIVNVVVTGMLGVDNVIDANSGIAVFPNPFSSHTNVVFDEEQVNSTIRIIDVNGQEIKILNVNGKSLEIEKGDLMPGIYFLYVMRKNKSTLTKKIIIQ